MESKPHGLKNEDLNMCITYLLTHPNLNMYLPIVCLFFFYTSNKYVELCTEHISNCIWDLYRNQEFQDIMQFWIAHRAEWKRQYP